VTRAFDALGVCAAFPRNGRGGDGECLQSRSLRRCHAAPVPYAAIASDSDPSGALLFLIACAVMADPALLA
jgi:hypothetical protein